MDLSPTPNLVHRSESGRRSPAPPRFEAAPSISGEAIERAQSEARRLRAQAMHEIFGAAATWVSSLGRRLVSAVTSRAAGSGPRQHC